MKTKTKSAGYFVIKQNDKVLAKVYNTATEQLYGTLASLLSGTAITLPIGNGGTYSTGITNYNSSSATYQFAPSTISEPVNMQFWIITANAGTISSNLTQASYNSTSTTIYHDFGIINSNSTSDTITEIQIGVYLGSGYPFVSYFTVSTNIPYNPSVALTVSFVLQDL